MQKIVSFIKGLNLTLSDYLLATGFLFFAVFPSFAWQFMVTADPNDIILKPWMFLTCFVVTFSTWSGYLYLQYKAGNLPHPIVSSVFFICAVTGLIAILAQPERSSIEVVMREVNEVNSVTYPGHNAGDIITVQVFTSGWHRTFFAMASVVIIEVFYIAFFVFPKRLKTVNFILLMALAIFIFLLSLVIYSYIAEGKQYIPFLKALFSGDMDGVYANAVKGFVSHRVPYGVCMMLGIGFALCAHSFHQKWYYYLIGAFFYINMIFSYCKSALVIAAIMIFAYIIFRLIVTYKEHQKRNKITLICIGIVAFVGILALGVSYLTKGKILSPLYKIIESFTGAKTIDSRSYIWDNTYHLLQNGWWIIGRGFGPYNQMLYQMNIVNGDWVCPSHSSWNAWMGQGGIIHLFAFLALLVYWFGVFFKCFKKDPYQAIAFAFPEIAFLMYSLTEGVHHLLLLFMIPMFFLEQSLKVKKEAN